MLRPLRVIALAAVLVGSLGFVPAVGEDVIICVGFKDTEVPGTSIRVDRPTERVCVKTPDPSAPLGER